MPTVRLTQLVVDRLTPPATGRVEYFDALLPGLGLRISATGNRSWIVFYRVDGRLRRHTIGTLARHPRLDAVRAEARRILAAVDRGQDPAAEQAVDRRNIVSDVIAEFIERHAKVRQRSWRDTERLLTKHVAPRWGTRPIKSIRKADVVKLMDDLAAEGLGAGRNRVLAWVRKLFVWALERDLIDATPVAGIRPPAVENRRERVLSDRELVAIWNAADKLPAPFGTFIHLLILTAQRRDEIARLSWREVSLSAGELRFPPDRTKAGRPHVVPLNEGAAEMLAAVPRVGEWVFTTATPDTPAAEMAPISGFSWARRKLDEALRKAAPDEPTMPAWSLHDLRRTAASGMARLGVDRFTIERVLNHADRSVSGIYDRHNYLPQMRDALDRWARHVSDAVRSEAKED